jgi:cytochrome c oxidase subunit IV
MASSHDARRIPEPAHDVSVATPHHPVPYVAIFLILVVLTVITVAVAWLNLESDLAKIAVALLIATIKGTFVVLYFMHLKFEGKLIYLILVVPLILCVILALALIPDTRPTVLFDHPGHEAAAQATDVDRPAPPARLE